MTKTHTWQAWAYVLEDGAVCAASEFDSAEAAWDALLGGPDGDWEIEAAKLRGCRVVRVTITEDP